MGLKRGDPASAFELAGTDGTEAGHRPYSLAEFRGAPVVLVFYPGDDTPVCTRQLNEYTQEIGRFRELDAAMVALSPQSVESHDQFAAKNSGFAFPLLADEDKAVGRSFGVVGPLGFYRRSVFVIDAGGRVAWVRRSIGVLGFQPTDDLIAAVSAT